MNLEIECMVVMDMVYGYVKGIWKLNICMELLFYEWNVINACIVMMWFWMHGI